MSRDDDTAPADAPPTMAALDLERKDPGHGR
jgi:hypothetical protein